jgi:small subunit ribosomal protein S6
MKLYELTYLIHPNLTKEDFGSLLENLKSYIEKEGGQIKESNNPLKKRLAYKIKGETEAFLSILVFALEPDNLQNLKKELKDKKEILRYLLLEKKITKEKKIKTRTKPRIKTEEKVELKEIEKKLEEILG